MTRRSAPQAKIDDRAFTVRMMLRTPEGGFGLVLDEALRWLCQTLGRSNYAWYGAARSPVATWQRRIFDTRPPPRRFWTRIRRSAGRRHQGGLVKQHLPAPLATVRERPVCNLYNQIRPAGDGRDQETLPG